MSILSVEQIAAADDLPRKVVEVPQWGGNVCIQGLTKQQQLDIRRRAETDGVVNEYLVELELLAESIVEPNLTATHIDMLRNKSADALDVILNEIYVLSSLDEEAVARKRVEFQEESESVDGTLHSEDAENDGEGS